MFKIPVRLQSFFYRYCIGLLILTICRILFYIFNHSYFSGIDAKIFLGGLHFDLSTLSYIFLPLFLLHIFYFIPWRNGIYQRVLQIVFHITTAVMIVLNCIDFEYFKFTFKRSSSDLFQLWNMGEDVERQLPQLLLDYWYLFFLAFFLIFIAEALYRLTYIERLRKINFYIHFTWIIIFTAAMVILARGGLQLKPLNVIQAGKYASAQNIPIVINTPFSVLKSLDHEGLRPISFYSQSELAQVYSPFQKFTPDSLSKGVNVVIIILEGFSTEYIGFINDYKGYTPFLDSLMGESMVFTNAFANGKKSIEALPAILSGLPALSENPYISSAYSSNKINSIAETLTKKGYSSSFYHGGANGTMGFDAFSRMAAIENYYGLSQYPNKDVDYDGNWGIFDEPYLQYFNKELSKKKKPFFSTVFTLSSHHPYTIPEIYEGKFNKGNLKIHESLGYTDYALQQFFIAAKKESYYKNTLFVLVADHTAQTEIPIYQGRAGMYRIPLIFHHNGKLKGVSDIVCQQADIFPSVIDYLNEKAEFLCFGNTVFSEHADHFAVNYLNGLYQFIEDEFVLHFDGENAVAFYNYKKDPTLSLNLLEKDIKLALEKEKKLKAIIQQYNNRLIKNNLKE